MHPDHLAVVARFVHRAYLVFLRRRSPVCRDELLRQLYETSAWLLERRGRLLKEIGRGEGGDAGILARLAIGAELKKLYTKTLDLRDRVLHEP